MAPRDSAPIERIDVAAYKIPTEQPESDGTLEWTATTMVAVHATAGGEVGFGYSYANRATAVLVADTLADVVRGRDAMDVEGSWRAMTHAIRNLGRPGISSMAISAVDAALWDLKAKLLDLPLVELFGSVRESVPVYGSGGFTSYSIEELRMQLSGWVDAGISRVKMKIGREPDRDLERVRAAREAIGPNAQLFVDANAAYRRKQALDFAERFAHLGVVWFEEPVSSDDLDGLRLLRDRAPAGMAITAGEYGYDQVYFRRMLEAGAVDILQADATRCAGLTGFLAVGPLCDGFLIPLSSHCAPALHLHAGCAVAAVLHLEYFFDHVRIERMLLDGAPEPVGGRLTPDRSRPGLGLELERKDAEGYRVAGSR